MQVNPSQHAQSKGMQKAARAADAASAIGQPAQKQAAQGKHQEIQHQIEDQSAIEPLRTSIITPGLVELLGKDSNSELIDDTLNSAMFTKMPGARQAAMRSLLGETKGMTPGQLDDLKDAIVKRMSSPDTTQNERDVLKNMYDVVDAVSENRPVPPHLIGINHVHPFPPGIDIGPVFPHKPGKPGPNILDQHPHDDSVFMGKDVKPTMPPGVHDDSVFMKKLEN
ncbi:MAG: hypothetical protein AB7I41_04555 [Candidatus Sericytochromatia bacterium]